MTTTTHGPAQFEETRHHPIAVALLVLLFWIIAAVLVAAGHAVLDPLSPATSAVVTMATIAAAAWAYTRWCARYAGLPRALAVGVAWLALAVITEVFLSARLGHGWYGLLTSPNRPLLRNLDFFVWIFAPALFARREPEA